MRRWTAAVITVAMSGCSFAMVRASPRHLPADEAGPDERRSMYCQGRWPVAVDVGIALSLAGVVILQELAAAAEYGNHPEVDHEGLIGRSGDVLSVLSIPVASAIYGLAATSVCSGRLDEQQEEQRRNEREIAREAVKREVRAITKAAAKAARDDNCLVAVARNLDVRSLDPEYHATVFMRDAAIKRCLDAAATEQPAVSP